MISHHIFNKMTKQTLEEKCKELTLQFALDFMSYYFQIIKKQPNFNNLKIFFNI